MQPRHEIGRATQAIECRFANAGHDAHAGYHVGAVRHLHPHLADRRIHRAQDVRHHVHRPASHGAAEQPSDFLFGFGRRHPVIGWSSVVLLARADEGYVLGARHVVRVAAVQEAIRIGLGVQAQGRAIAEHLLHNFLLLLFRAVTPDDALRPRCSGDFFNPLF